jgi:hypothetical protein
LTKETEAICCLTEMMQVAAAVLCHRWLRPWGSSWNVRCKWAGWAALDQSDLS